MRWSGERGEGVERGAGESTITTTTKRDPKRPLVQIRGRRTNGGLRTMYRAPKRASSKFVKQMSRQRVTTMRHVVGLGKDSCRL